MYDVAGPVIKYSERLKETQKIKPSESLVLRVDITGVPATKTTWSRNGAEITSGQGITVEGDGTFSQLTVNNTTPNETFEYEVVVKNNDGSDSAKFNVIFLGSFNSRHLVQSCTVCPEKRDQNAVSYTHLTLPTKRIV